MHPLAHRCLHRDPHSVPVVDESGSHLMCGLCLIQLVAEAQRGRVRITVFREPVPTRQVSS